MSYRCNQTTVSTRGWVHYGESQTRIDSFFHFIDPGLRGISHDSRLWIGDCFLGHSFSFFLTLSFQVGHKRRSGAGPTTSVKTPSNSKRERYRSRQNLT